jgi:hypothetical protein
MYGNFALFDDDGKFESGERIYLTDLEGKNEGWLRDTLFDHPEIIPVDDIDSTFGPLVPLCKELRTEVGSVDAVFINALGRLTLVECKLWKNPEARRQLVAQTLDYVAALSRWSYADLQAKVAAALRKQGNNPFELVQKKAGAQLREPEFIDAVSRSLREGRFLILLAGDGIREGIQSLTELVNRNATKAFTFGVIEVAIYQFAKNRFALQPRLLAETESLIRQLTVLNLEGGDLGSIEVADESSEDHENGGKDHLKAWWKPVLNMKFDDPDQEPPYWTATNNMVLSTPFPGILIKAASLKPKDYVEVFLSATRTENLDPIRRLAKRDKQYLLDNLPKGTVVNDPRLGWPVAVTNQQLSTDAEKYAWLKENLNAFVNVLRPQLRKWHEEMRV